jgi:hypothetical protein
VEEEFRRAELGSNREGADVEFVDFVKGLIEAKWEYRSQGTYHPKST